MDTARTWRASWQRMERNPPGPNFTHTFKGVAPNANIVNLRVLDANGNGQESDVIAAIDEAIALKDKYNIRVINLSLGTRGLRKLHSWIRCARPWRQHGRPASPW